MCCDCGGGDANRPSSIPTVSTAPSISPRPTPGPVTASDFDELEGAICDQAKIDVVSDIAFTKPLSIDSVTVHITSSTMAVLDGGDTTQFFLVLNYGKLTLEFLTLTHGGENGFGGAICIVNAGLVMQYCKLENNFAGQVSQL